jgi:hypothetical protein
MQKGGSATKGATMKITLEVPPHREEQLRQYMAKRDPADVQRELDAAFDEALTLALAKDQPPLSDEEFEAILAELDAHEGGTEDGPAMRPDETFSREMIYGDHP